MTRFAKTRTLLKITVTLTLLVSLAANRPAKAQETAVVKLSQTVELDGVGNAATRLTIKLPTNLYTQLKASTPNMAVLLRQLGAGRHWALIEDIQGDFQDIQSSVVIRYTLRGLGRVERDDEWVVPFEKGAKLDVVDIHDNVAILNQTASSPLGLITAIIRVIAPKGSTELAQSADESSITYRFTPASTETGAGSVRFAMDHKEALMSCLAKCYSNEQFNQLWVGRSRFDNAGGEVLTDYRVRFRVAGFGYWSRWNRTSTVFPGQTVVDPFFPVFDLDKLNTLTGSRPAMLEVEYEYRRPNGERVSETDSFRLQVLGRNETIFSGLAYSEVLTFADRFEYLPAVMASFTTPNDPVIQQLAGRISGRADGAAAAFTNEDAVKFLRAMYEFLVDNKVAYQTPPSYVNGARFGQHIKYGRDVLQNRAGTCIDLAILWASACEAVGLNPVLILVPGHCFPAVELPGGQVVAIESTTLGKATFDKSVEIGMKELAEARQGSALFVNIRDLRKAGVQCLDLPSVPHNFLAELGYSFDPPRQTVQNEQAEEVTVQRHETHRQGEEQNQEQEQNEEQEEQQQVEHESVRPAELVGTWGFSGQDHTGSTQIGLSLLADGRLAYVMKLQAANGQTREIQDMGRWSIEENQLVIETNQGGVSHCDFELRNGQLFIYFPKIDTTIGFVRLK
jgi:hypothetical protein